MKLKILLFICFLFLYRNYFISAQQLPKWKNGYLDIHHINTGRGDATFCIFPDGTTMLVDAGENNRISKRVVAAKPNKSISSGMWIAKYIQKIFPSNYTRQIDYCLLTHYHSDHLGAAFTKKNNGGDYYITGISEVYDNIPICKIIDRGYQYMKPQGNDTCFSNYLSFVSHLVKNKLSMVDSFIVGTDKQFILKHDPKTYSKDFKIRNVYSNGKIWTGNKDNIKQLFPATSDFNSRNMPRENMYSCVIKLTYGKFDYYTGGDIPGYPRPGRPSWHDIETPVSSVIKQVDVAVLNHHGNEDGTNDNFIRNLSPQIFIMSTWDALHPNHTVLQRILSKELYPNNRFIFSTNIHPATNIVIGDIISKMSSTHGHIVVRVSPHGETFQIYILDDSSIDCNVIKKFGPFKCI